MAKKYTMSEFEDMFIKSQIETTKQLEKDFEERADNKDMLHKTMWNMHNMMVMASLYNNLFGNEEK